MKKLLLLVFFLFVWMPAYAEDDASIITPTTPSSSEWDINGTANASKKDDTETPPWKNPDTTAAKEPEGSDDCRMPPWVRKPGLKCD